MVKTTQEYSRQDASAETVATTRFGEIKVDVDKIITMASPFLGFPESNRYVLLPHNPSSPFMWLQSLDDPGLAFVVIQPAVIAPDYKPALTTQIKEELGVSADEKPDLLVILTIPRGRPRDMTANLLGPVVINTRTRLAKQALLDPTEYGPCWPVFGENIIK